MPLSIEQAEVEPGIVVITLAGKMLLGQEGQQVEALVGDLLKQGHRKIVFELSGVTHIDSTGIGRFISSYNQVMRVGGQMLMAAATGIVREGFRVTRLDTVFRFYPDLESAKQALS
jgi:anti-sigma B factor antagonist